MHHTLPRVRMYLFFVAPLVILSLFLLLTPIARGISNSVVISEIEVGGFGTGHTTEEFVELFNTSSTPIDLNGWTLAKKTASATQSAVLLTLSGSIPPYSYLLVAHQDSTTSADLRYSGDSIANNNTLLLYRENGQTLVDTVGMGIANDFEGAAAVNPAAGKSIARSLCGMDTDNNSLDFTLQSPPTPQNSQTPPENSCGPLATPSPSPTPTPEPSSSPTPTPTLEPTSTPSPTPEPTIVPTATPSPTPEVTPTPAPSPTIVPTAQPTSTPKPNGGHHQHFPKLVCKTTYEWVWFRRWKVRVPRVTCTWEYTHHHSSHWHDWKYWE